MTFIYHWVPKDIRGDVLYPLNILAQSHPEVAEKHIQKYKDRGSRVLEQYVPILNCLWNDVLHFSITDPQRVVDELGKFGEKREFIFYKVDPHLLESGKTVLFINREREPGTLPRVEEFIAYDPNDLEKWNYFPEETSQYYEKRYAEGKTPLVYHGLPHVLYKGNLSVSDLEIVKFQSK